MMRNVFSRFGILTLFSYILFSTPSLAIAQKKTNTQPKPNIKPAKNKPKQSSKPIKFIAPTVAIDQDPPPLEIIERGSPDVGKLDGDNGYNRGFEVGIAGDVPITYADFVNPMVGTGGHGHTFPGAVWPFGMVAVATTSMIPLFMGFHIPI